MFPKSERRAGDEAKVREVPRGCLGGRMWAGRHRLRHQQLEAPPRQRYWYIHVPVPVDATGTYYTSIYSANLRNERGAMLDAIATPCARV